MPPRPRTALYLLPDLGIGGGQVIIHRTLEAMDDPAWRHVVCAVRDGPMRARLEASGIRTEVLGVTGHLDHVRGLRRLAHLVREEPVDVVVSPNSPLDRAYAQLTGEACRVPVVIWFMSLAVELYRLPPPRGRVLTALKGYAYLPGQYLSYRRATRLVALSGAVAASYEHLLRLAPGSIGVVAPGLAPEAFAGSLDEPGRRGLRDDLGLDGAWPVIINVGMLIDLKGQHLLVPMLERLAADLPRAHLLLVGEGVNRARIEALVDRAGLADRVTLLGHREDVHELLQVSDLFISASDQEGFGMAVLEAMAMGLPVVAARTPAFAEFLTEGTTAELVDVPDDALLAGAVRSVFAGEGKHRAMGEAGRAAAAARTVDATARRLLTVLEEAAGPRRSG